ncbi:MAG: response regulator [Bacteroidetes bacterium]|jgi:DNA-binding NtrC family response regulator|nr:response regulator [Bacteroidota bacterium]
MKKRVFVVDDEPKIGDLFSNVLERDGYSVETFMNPLDMLDRLGDETQRPDVILADMMLPDLSGVELLEVLEDRGVSVPVIIMTAHSSVQTAVEAMQHGAFHYLQKPVNLEEMRALLKKALEMHDVQRELKTIKDKQRAAYPIDGILGESNAVVKVRETIDTLSEAPSTTVMFSGETGTGKNLAAKTLHYNSPRSKKAFTEINCAALPDNLLEAELFGYEKGAFTDARDSKQGLIEVADGGSLFLDEIDSMSMALQAKLLSFLESRTFRRLGGVEDMSVDVRVLCATNAKLEESVQEGEFRKDLYFRINVVNVHLPPLRQMGDDVLIIAQSMIEQFNKDMGASVEGFTEGAREKLLQHEWPGNVRELRNVLERAMIFTEGPRIQASDLTLSTPEQGDAIYLMGNAFQFPLGRSLKDLERAYIRRTLEENDSSYADIADSLGISKKTLWDKRKRYNLDEVVDR